MSGGKGGSQTVGYKYYAGVQMVICAGPIDRVIRIQVADREAWAGQATGSTVGYDQIYIHKPELFGGKRREGGIQGTVDLGMGYPAQPRNDYLLAKVSSMVSAYRGVVSLILRQLYLGNNPYLKPWKVTAQRIHVKGIEGSPQWYDQKAAIFSGYADAPGPVAVTFALDVSGSMFPPLSNRYDVVKDAMMGVLDYVANTQIPHDIRIVLWSTVTHSMTRRNVTPADVVDLKAFVNGATNTGGTDANAAVSGSGSFFAGSGSKPYKFVVITDGEMSNADSAAATLFSTPGVESFGFNIALSNTTQTDKLDNTGGTQVINDGDSDAILNAFVASLKMTIYDMNPAHIIRECLTEQWGRGLPASEVGPSYQAVADQLHSEGLGLSIMWQQESPIDEFINEVIRHIDAVRYEDPETGLQEIRLIRDDYDVNTLPVLDPSNSDLVQFTEPSTADLYSQVTIKYWNRATGEDDSVVLQDTAAINMLGTIVNQTMEYPGFTTKANAIKVGQRDLARFSRPFAKGSIRTLRKFANLRPGDLFVLNDPDNGIAQMVCRVAKRTENGLLNGEIVLDFGEDVFGAGYTTYATPPPSGWVDPIGPPQDFLRTTALEVPYYFLVKALGQEVAEALSPGAGFYGLVGVRPTGSAHINYQFWTYPDGTGPDSDPETSIPGDFTPMAYLDADAGPTDTVLTISQVDDGDSVRDRQLILAGDGVDSERELLILDGTLGPTITVLRGGADTVPRPLVAGTPLYFIEAFLGLSPTEYLDGETVEGYGAPINGKGTYPGPYTYRDLAMVGRAHRPYPAANLKVNGEYEITQQLSNDIFVVTWRHRDRVLQADQAISWFADVDYGPEPGVTYRVSVDALDGDGNLIAGDLFAQDLGQVNTHTFNFEVDVLPYVTVYVDLKVRSVRDGITSLQATFTRVRVFTAPQQLTGGFTPD